jgi:phosphate transport system substrate-binding protein
VGADRLLLSACRLLFIALLLSACTSPAPVVTTSEPTTLRLVATDACGPLMEELAVAYQAAHPWAVVEVEVFDDAVAEERLRTGAADLAALVWPGREADLWLLPFASDAIAVIVHPAVPVEGLDRQTLREIFRGRIGEWADGTPVQVVSREAGSGVRALFEAEVMDGYDVTLTALVVADDAGVLAAVASTPGAIGYVPLSRLDGDVRVVAVDGVLPAAARRADAPLAYVLFLVTPGEPQGEARAFMQWVLGPEGQELVTRRLGSPL